MQDCVFSVWKSDTWGLCGRLAGLCVISVVSCEICERMAGHTVLQPMSGSQIRARSCELQRRARRSSNGLQKHKKRSDIWCLIQQWLLNMTKTETSRLSKCLVDHSCSCLAQKLMEETRLIAWCFKTSGLVRTRCEGSCKGMFHH